MKIKPLIIFLSTLIIGFTSYYFLASTHPSDESMKTFFEQNRVDFEKLRTMFEEDKGCTDISYDKTSAFSDYSKEGDCQISEARHNEYRKLFQKLRIDARIKRDWSSRNKLTLRTSYNSTDSPPDDYGKIVSEKGFFYSPDEPTSIRDSLNIPNVNGYKKLSGNWYLFSNTWHYRGE